jgi:cyclopropane-fatty-acyl-phospholipid synthase
MSTISSTSTASVSHTRPTRAPSWLDRAARRTLFAALARLRIGHLIIRDGNDATSFGSSTHHPFAEIRVLDPRFYRACLTRGTLGAAEAFLDHWWTCDQLTDLVRLLVLNREAMRSIDSGWSKATLPLRRAAEALRKNTHVGSRRNIAAHYDLSNDLFTRSCSIRP